MTTIIINNGHARVAVIENRKDQPVGWARVIRQAGFGQRWQSETVFSMLKRNLDHAIAARTYWSQCREMMLLAITHNVMILWRRRGFLRSILSPFFGPVAVSDSP